jgi:peptidoglycan/xylan/chitin deacetylase (PgdA/CDA1 family)
VIHPHLMPLINPFFRLPGRWSRRRARKIRMALQLLALAVVLLVLLPAYIVYKPPKSVISYLQSRNPSVLFQIQTSRKIVALTIDDAPSPYTREILDILKDNHVTATFFVIGNQVPGNEDVLADIVRAGHELGNHAMHDEPSISLSSDLLAEEIHQVDALIDHAYEQGGRARTSHYFRPGSGVFSHRILGIAEKAGYQTILGSIYPHDPFISRWRVNAWHVLSSLRPGAVIICHDRRSWTVPMLKKALPAMKEKGFEVTSVSGLLGSLEGN